MPFNDYTYEELLEMCENLYDSLTKKYSIYVTYQLFEYGAESGKTMHCNYIKRIDTDIISGARVQLFFGNDSFKFLNNGNNGYSADRLYILVNVVENKEIEEGYELVKPKSNEWRIYDMGGVTKPQLQTENFIVSIDEYEGKELYNLDYAYYPESNLGKKPLVKENHPSTGVEIPFSTIGDETFFFGNIETQRQAIIHSTDLPIKLPLNEFNTTTNRTWDGETSVYVTEIGIYDDDDNLVAIGKFNDPIEKNPNVSRTIIFSLDF